MIYDIKGVWTSMEHEGRVGVGTKYRKIAVAQLMVNAMVLDG